MLLSFSDIMIIMSRLFLETISYYNAKTMYALKGYDKISPLLVLYLTHSLGAFLFFRDLLTYRKNYISKVEKDTQIPFKVMIYATIFLSLFYNLCHIPKFYAMNYISDVSIVSIYGCSVIFTYIFAVLLINAKLDSLGIFSVGLGVIGMLFLVWNDSSISKHSFLVLSVCISSILSGMYGVFYKMVMCYNHRSEEKICLDCIESLKLNILDVNDKEESVQRKCNECLRNYNETKKTKMNDQNNNIHLTSCIGNTNDTELNTMDLTKNHTTNRNEDMLNSSDNSYKVNKINAEINNNIQNINANNQNKISKINAEDLNEIRDMNIKNPNMFQTIPPVLPKTDAYQHPIYIDHKVEGCDTTLSYCEPTSEADKIEINPKNINHKIEFKDDVIYKPKKILNYKISEETYRKLMFMRHYISLTGLFTLILYWPGLCLVHCSGCENIKFPINPRPLFHLIVANIFSLLHNLIYFIIVAVRTPLFAQISGIIMQPTFLFISIVENKGITCIRELTGCVLSFTAFLLLCNRH